MRADPALHIVVKNKAINKPAKKKNGDAERMSHWECEVHGQPESAQDRCGAGWQRPRLQTTRGCKTRASSPSASLGAAHPRGPTRCFVSRPAARIRRGHTRLLMWPHALPMCPFTMSACVCLAAWHIAGIVDMPHCISAIARGNWSSCLPAAAIQSSHLLKPLLNSEQHDMSRVLPTC